MPLLCFRVSEPRPPVRTLPLGALQERLSRAHTLAHLCLHCWFGRALPVSKLQQKVGGREGGGGGHQLSYGLRKRMMTSKPLDGNHTSATIPGAGSLVRRWGWILRIWK